MTILKNAPTPSNAEIVNEHIKAVAEATNGWSALFDLTKTEASSEVSKFQGDTTLLKDAHPIFFELADRIAEKLEISKEHVFFQYIVLGAGGGSKKALRCRKARIYYL